MRGLVKEAPIKSIARTNGVETVFRVGYDVKENLESDKVDSSLLSVSKMLVGFCYARFVATYSVYSLFDYSGN